MQTMNDSEAVWATAVADLRASLSSGSQHFLATLDADRLAVLVAEAFRKSPNVHVRLHGLQDPRDLIEVVVETGAQDGTRPPPPPPSSAPSLVPEQMALVPAAGATLMPAAVPMLLQRALAVAVAAAGKVQAAARGLSGRRAAATRVAARQTIVRALHSLCLLRREVRCLSATLIQANWRGVCTRVALAAEASAANRIGATWRAQLGRKQLQTCKPLANSAGNSRPPSPPGGDERVPESTSEMRV